MNSPLLTIMIIALTVRAGHQQATDSFTSMELNFSNATTDDTDQRNESHILCRNEAGVRLPLVEYSLDTCARCYMYIHHSQFQDKLSYIGEGRLHDNEKNTTVYSNETSVISSSFASLASLIKWRQCCLAAIECCSNYLHEFKQGVEDTNTCPRTWDGWSCWKTEVLPLEERRQTCPDYIFDAIPPCGGSVTKSCGENGSWYERNGREWSDYSNCARVDMYIRRIHYSIITNVISIVTIIPALFIFNYYKQLSSVSRIRLHKHLFASLLFHAIVICIMRWYILEEFHVKNGPTVCLLLSLLMRYFRSTTYLWMFNEALYLHQLIRNAFSQPPLKPLILFAYSIPFATTAAYSAFRMLSLFQPDDSKFPPSITHLDVPFPGSNITSGLNSTPIDYYDYYNEATTSSDKCWLLPSPYAWHEWIINVPNLAILMVNSVFLGLLLRVLCKKASSMSNCSPSNQSHQIPQSQSLVNRCSVMVSIRAAVLLLPLYGLHYIVIVYRPNISICWLAELYHYLYLTLDGLQGTAVAVIFCYANNEIRYHLNRTFERVSPRQRSTTIYLTEVMATQNQN